jgi:putative heme-binding domain-containing protein
LTDALENPSPKVQRAALLLLDQAPFQATSAPAVVARLNSQDQELRAAARWVLLRHREWGEAGASFLRSLLELPNPSESDRQALSRFLPLFATNAVVMTALADSLAPTNQAIKSEQRARLLESLATLDMHGLPVTLAVSLRELLHATNNQVALAAVHAAASLRLSGADEALTAIAYDPARSLALRIEAMREIVRRHPVLDSAAMELLFGWLSTTNPPAVRLSASEILTSARLNPAQSATLLKALRGDSLISPAAVLEAFERNSLQPDIAVALLDYLAASLDAGWTVSADRLAKVQAAVPETQRAQAQALVARLSEAIARQRQQLTELAPLLKGGDYLKGEKLFFEKAQCVICHRIWANGGRVGPDLSRIGAIRSGQDILESIVVPSATIAQGYETLNVTTKDGESYSGVRVGSGDNPLRLRLGSGTEMVIHSGEIDHVGRSKVSIMPEGLLNNLAPEEARDLLAFLQQLK